MAMPTIAQTPPHTAVVFPGRRSVVHLSFPVNARHPLSRTPLRLWAKSLPGAKWDPKRKCWTVQADRLPRGALSEAGFAPMLSNGCVPTRSDMAERQVPLHTDVPDWFGLELAPFQIQGAKSLLSGKALLADAPGVGKTRQALAAVAAHDWNRVLVVCPPVVLHHWAREIEQSGLVPGLVEEPSGRKERETNSTNPGLDSILAILESGKKNGQIPGQGIVLVPDTLLAARPALADELRAWRPDILVYDEAHRAKTWDSQRSVTMRYLSHSSSVTYCLTGTPIFANPAELLPILEMTGHLEPVFGGEDAYTSRYLRRNQWNQWVPVSGRLPELKAKLDAHVWLRRTKDEVLPDLPTKSRHVEIVDVDLAGYRNAHKQVVQAIKKWIKELDHTPDHAEVVEWTNGQMGLISLLRSAAGLCKIEAATDWVSNWLEGNPGRPLVVWAHHRAVSEAMAQSARGAVTSSAAILGGTPHQERDRIVNDFQAGKIRLLVCSIAAAGVGITLTRSSDALFVETDWTPAMLTQAEDRICRIGQTQPVTITTLVAVGTLDEQIQSTLAKKSLVLDAVLGGSADNHAEVYSDGDENSASILVALVKQIIRGRK